MRVDVSSNYPSAHYVRLKSYAYEATPNTPIIAGDIGPQCDVSTGVSVVNTGSTFAKITWNAVANATSYRVYYKPVGQSVFPIPYLRSNDETRRLSDLLPGTNYVVRVKAHCPGIGWSDVSAPLYFTTPVIRKNEELENGLNANIYSFHKNIHLQIHDWQNGMNAEAAVFDLLGKRIYQSQISQQDEVINLQSHPTGIYVVELKMGNAVQKKKVYLNN